MIHGMIVIYASVPSLLAKSHISSGFYCHLHYIRLQNGVLPFPTSFPNSRLFVIIRDDISVLQTYYVSVFSLLDGIFFISSVATASSSSLENPSRKNNI